MLAQPPRRVVCSGNICFDILARPVERFEWHRTVWVDSIQHQLGGNGSNTAYALATLGVPVRLLGMVGRDDWGERVLSTLSGAGVDLSAVGRSAAPTNVTICVVNAAGDRLFLQQLGSSTEALSDPIDFASLARDGFTHYHMANLFNVTPLRPRLGETLRRAREAGLTTSADTGWDALDEWMQVVAPCLPYCDLFFTNQDEARMLTGCPEPDDAARRLRERGVRDVAIKLGPLGCALYTAEGEIRVPAFEVEVVDTTGAGDSFAGGFLAALHRGADYCAAARFANAVGALSVGSLGAVVGLRSWDETQAWIARRG